MKQINFFSLLVSIFLLSSCIKDVNYYTITGRLVEDCNNVPIVGRRLELWQQREVGNEKPTLATATTDANGNFSFKYQVDNDNNPLSLKGAANLGYYTYMERIPQRQNLENILVYQNPTTNIKVMLNVINPHAVGDTLEINNLITRVNMHIPCPLTSGELYTVTNYPVISYKYGNSEVGMAYRFTSSPGNTTYYTIKIDKYCSDTVEAVIDIR